jgi:serine/threonine-protein kinase RsbT
MSEPEHGTVQIEVEADIAVARRVVRDVAGKIGFGITETTRIITAASELGRNVFKYAGKGAMHWRILQKGTASGVELSFEDHGPGIADLDAAMREGYSSGGSLGMGLPGAKRLMDELDVKTALGEGTTVVVRKWRRA